MKNKNIIYVILIILVMFIIAIDVYTVRKKGGIFNIFNFKEDSKQTYNNNILKNVEINGKLNGEIIVYLESSFQLTLTSNLSSNANRWDYNWLSTNQNIATVSTTGNVYGKNSGMTTVRVTNKNDSNIYDIVNIRVIEKDNKLEFSNEYESTIQLIKGEIKKLDVNVGGNIALGQLQWSSSDIDICNVEDGYVYAKENGKVVITVKSLKDSKYFDTIDIEISNESYTPEVPNDININAIYVNNKEVTNNIETLDIYVGDIITINSSCNVTTNAMVNFKLITDNLSFKNVDQYVATFTCDDIGEAVINISSTYNNLLNKNLKFEIKPKMVDEIILKKPILEEVDNNLICEMDENTSIELELLGSNTLLDEDDYSIEIYNNEIATIEKNFLIGKKVGSTTITISYKYYDIENITFTLYVKENFNNKIEYITIENSKLNNNTFKLNKYSINNVTISDTVSFNVIVTPYIYATNNNYLIYSTDSHIATCTTTYSDNQYLVEIEFIEIGNVQIIIKFFDNFEQEIVLDFNIENTDFELSAQTVLKMQVGKTYNLYTNVTNSLSKKLNFKYTSSNPEVISIGNNGNMLAIAEGTSNISVIVDDGKIVKHKTFSIDVEQIYVEYNPVTIMNYKTYLLENDVYEEIDFTNRILSVFQRAYLEINVTPNFNNANNYQVITSNSEILSITYINNMYQLYALSAGIATIYIKNYENSELDLSFEIKVCEVLPKYLVAVLEKNILSINEYQKLELNIDPNATFSNVTYEYSVPNIVKIVDNIIIPLKSGETTIILKVDDSDEETKNYYFTIPIKVIESSIFETYSIIEIFSYVIFHIVVYAIFGIYLLILIKKIQIKKLFLILIIILFPLLTSIFPELLKLKNNNINIVFLSIFLNITSCSISMILTNFLLKYREKNTHENI